MTLSQYHDAWARHNAMELRDGSLRRAVLEKFFGFPMNGPTQKYNPVASRIYNHPDDVVLVLNGKGMKDAEAQAYRECYRRFDGCMSKVAAKMGVGRSTAYKRVKELGLALVLIAGLAGCSTPTVHRVEPVQPLPSIPQPGAPTTFPRPVNIRPPQIVTTTRSESHAPTAAPIPSPFTNVLATWSYRPNESLMVIHSKTNLYGPWAYRTSTTNTSIKFPANKQQEWFWFWPIQKGGSFHYGSGYVLAPR